jgi:hypothetical protein
MILNTDYFDGAFDPSTFFCSASVDPCAGFGSLQAGVFLSTPAGCPPGSPILYSVTLDKKKVAVGQTVNLPDPAAGIVGGGCGSWTGTVQFISDAPSWSIAVDATCADQGMANLKFAGTFSGDL